MRSRISLIAMSHAMLSRTRRNLIAQQGLTHKDKLRIALACTTAALAIAGCGSVSRSTTSTHQAAQAPAAPVSSVLHVTAGPGPTEFTTRSLQAQAGRIELQIANHSELPQIVRIETAHGSCCFQRGNSDLGGTNELNPGTTATEFVTLKPGRYYFVGSPGYWQSGMWGTLIVH